jgi:hypothetical protein
MARSTAISLVALAVLVLPAACDTSLGSPPKASPTALPSATGMPRMSAGATMAYDPGGRQVLLFGLTEDVSQPTTWTWDGRVWTRQRPEPSPPALSGSLATDWGRSSVILFGTTGLESQTWEWKDGTWTQRHPAAEPPSNGYAFSIGSDDGRGVIAFGGCCAQTVLPSQTWRWDGNGWSQLQPKTAPSNRTGVHFAYDAAIQRTVLFGGNVGSSGSQSNDLWTWDGATWLREYPYGTPPVDLANAAVGYDGAHKDVVLLARSGKFDVRTWTWAGQTWTQQHPLAIPSTTVEYSMVWDDATAQLILFDIVSVLPPQTWTWSGSNWERKA